MVADSNPELFSRTLACALEKTAQAHGFSYTNGASEAWAATGSAYIGFVLCDYPLNQLRQIQYRTREEYGPIIMDCKWYDMIKQFCLMDKNNISALVPSQEKALKETVISGEMIIEMLDFCREG